MRNTLQLAPATPVTGTGQPAKFSEIAQLAGISGTDWSWAPLFADFDNDGWKDLFITNGYLRDITDKDFLNYSNNLSMFKSPGEADRELLPKIRQLKGKRLPNRIFKNNRDLTFSTQSTAWGMTQPSCSNGAVYADLDGDGDLDLVVNNINEPAFVFENKADKLLKNNYLNIKLSGSKGNEAGIGASVFIVSGGQRQYLEQYLSRGFMSSVTNLLHFGLGKHSTIDTLEVRWNNGRRQVLTGISANQTLTLKQIAANLPPSPETPPVATLMTDITGQSGVDFTHRNQIFNDFQFQPLLPHGFSGSGPPVATGDLDGDGLQDFYVGGGTGQSGRVFYQKTDGTFIEKAPVDAGILGDVAAAIFDANGDGRNDLFVASGMSGHPCQCRLYINDGKGNLIWAQNALPDIQTPVLCVAVADFDGDGDPDLFIGGSAEPGRYPMPARSWLLRNAGGRFEDATASVAPGLEKSGIVTAAQWADVDRDGRPDLVLVGEWMPITVFKNNGGILADATAALGLSNTAGWWNSLAVSDINGDGYPDFVAGNLGLNTKFAASPAHPLTLYAKDFDRNGSLDAVMCRFADGKEKPVHQRDELLAQINGLSKKYPRYALYADASIQDIFGTQALSDAVFREAAFMQTACFLYQNGRYVSSPLPMAAQTAPVNAILCGDFNGDKKTDLLLTGNSDSPNVGTGRYDAFNGLLLLGDGTGGFQALDAGRSGFYVDGVGSGLAMIPLLSGKKRIVAAVNGGPLRVFDMLIQNPNIIHQ
jgi:hypothetical protein